MLQKPEKYDKIKTKSGWLICPACGQQRLIKLLPTTRATDLQVYCRRCHKESIVNIPAFVPVP